MHVKAQNDERFMGFEWKATIYSSQKATSKRMMIMNMRKEEPKGDEYIDGPCLSQRVENLYAHSNESP